MFVTNWISTTKIQKISEITNFFRHYFLSRTEVSFTIKTIYGKMKLADLQDIVLEYKDNPVVLEIIKARVIYYVYNNYVDLGTRQKIGQLCNLRLVDDSGINRKKLINRK